MARADIGWALADLKARTPAYLLYRNYEVGRHRFTYVSKKYRTWFAEMVRDLNVNLCPTVLQAVTERTELTGWDDGDAQQADRLWDLSKMGARSSTVHQTAFREGDSYVLVWPGIDGQERFWPHTPDQMTVRMDDANPGYPELAAKVWSDRTGRGRINLYYPDVVERWVTARKLTDGWPQSVAQFVPYTEDRDGPTIGHGYGRPPVVHFPNGEGLAGHGRSELADVVPLQDALNKSAADLLIAEESFALPLRVFTGVVERERDVEGREVPIKITPQDVGLTFGGTDTKPWQLPAADLDKLLSVRDQYQLEVARVTGTPLHYFMLGQGQFPSGEALVVAEARLVSKVENRQQTFGPQWQEAMWLAGVPADVG